MFWKVWNLLSIYFFGIGLVLLTRETVASQKVTEEVCMIDLPVVLLLGARVILETPVVHGVPQLQDSAGYSHNSGLSPVLNRF